MKGMAYQQDTAASGATADKTKKYIDPLSDEKSCKRDIPILEELGVNIIRTYAIDPKADHKSCMKMLNDAGIYVVSDLSEPSLSVNRDAPVWDTELFQRYKDVVDEMGQYSNVVGFFAGNEVSNNASNTGASAFVKAAVRDTKKYIKDQKFSHYLGVGYAANDDKAIRSDMAYYFNCGPAEEAIDFWGYNIYSWCGQSSMSKSGYDQQVEFFKNYSVPVFLAEYGCNEPSGAKARIWQETTALYSDEMTGVFSGGIVYMYFQEANDYGVVEVKDGKATKQKDFDGLKKAHAKADPKGVDLDDYKVSELSAADCPSVGSKWQASSNLPPTPDAELCKCMSDSRECVVSKSVDSDDYGKLFGEVCGTNPKVCAGISANTTIGNFGAYSMCTAKEKLNFVLDKYYNSQNKGADACDWNGRASKQTASLADGCKKGMDVADATNEKVATATVALAQKTGGSSSDGESFGTRSVEMSSIMSVGAYLVAAMAVGASMIVL